MSNRKRDDWLSEHLDMILLSNPPTMVSFDWKKMRACNVMPEAFPHMIKHVGLKATEGPSRYQQATFNIEVEDETKFKRAKAFRRLDQRMNQVTNNMMGWPMKYEDFFKASERRNLKVQREAIRQEIAQASRLHAQALGLTQRQDQQFIQDLERQGVLRQEDVKRTPGCARCGKKMNPDRGGELFCLSCGISLFGPPSLGLLGAMNDSGRFPPPSVQDIERILDRASDPKTLDPLRIFIDPEKELWKLAKLSPQPEISEAPHLICTRCWGIFEVTQKLKRCWWCQKKFGWWRLRRAKRKLKRFQPVEPFVRDPA